MNNKQRDEIKAMLSKSKRTLEDARLLLDNERYEAASSRAYYAAFHCIQAILLSKGLTFSKHSGAISAFSRNFLKEGIFPKEFAKHINSLRKHREVSDYAYLQTISKEKAEEDLVNAAKLIEVIEQYLIKELLIDA